MGRKKKAPTFIRSLRVDLDTKEFLEQIENANIFVLQLIQDTDEYKKYLAKKKSEDNSPTLFD